MKTANEILADFHIDAVDAARMACVIEAHAQELDDCLTLIGDLRSGYFDWDEIPAEYAKQLVDDYRTISAMFRLIQSTLVNFVGDLDAARGAASPDRTAYLAGVYDHK